MRGRRSQTQFSTLLKIIIVIVSFIAILGIFTSLKTSFEETTEGTACRTALAARAKTLEARLIPDLEVACEHIQHDISLKDYETKDEIMSQIAGDMTNAWWMSGNGEIKNLWGGDSILRSRQCLTLYTITFSEVDKRDFEDDTITAEELEEYLQETDYNDDYTYHTYIQVSGGTGAYNIDEDIELEEGETYTISISSPDLGWFESEDTTGSTILILSDLRGSTSKGCDII